METFTDAVGLRVPSFGPAVVDVLYRQIQLILVMLALAALFGAAISEHPQQRDVMFLEEGQHAVIEQVGRHQRVLAVIEFGKSYLAIGVLVST